MGIVKDEQSVKQKSNFLKYESGDDGNLLILKSHLYQVDSHFLESVSRSVICKAGECLYCSAGYQLNSEYNYWVDLNGEIGMLDVKGSVFFSLQKIARVQKKDIREISWTVIKAGVGKQTKYTASKYDSLTPEDYEKIQQELESNTQKLVSLMERREEELNTNYTEYMGEIRQQTSKKKDSDHESGVE